MSNDDIIHAFANLLREADPGAHVESGYDSAGRTILLFNGQLPIDWIRRRMRPGVIRDTTTLERR